MSGSTGVTRREFLESAALVSSGLVIAFMVPGARRALAAEPSAPEVFAPNAYLRIGKDDRVTVLLAHSEMGQGIWTTLPLLLAEELDADWRMISAEHAPAAPAYAHTAFGMQMTGGSTTTWSEFDRYRQAGAAARVLLVQAGAAKLGVPVAACRTDNGAVIAGEKSVRYGDLVEAASKLPTPKSVALKDPKDWKLLGKPTKRLDSREKITGRAQFGMDVQMEGLLTAVVARGPVFGAKVKSFDAAQARAVPGVRSVAQIPSGIAVIAENFWAAKLGRDALRVEWDAGPHAALDSSAMRTQFRDLAASGGLIAAKAGDVDGAMASAAKTVEAEYAVPYLAHATMEPMNATVKIGPRSCEIWTGTQFQTMDQKIAAERLGLKPEQVTIHTMFLGGGFGRRANPVSDFVAEAVEVAIAAGSKVGSPPVKTVWTREDDMRGGYFRPAFLHAMRVGLGSDGLPVAWKHAIAGQSLLAGTPFEAMMVKDGIDGTSVEGVADSPYLDAIPNRRVELSSPRTGIPVLWWRSVGHSHSAFAMESMVDELALAASKDPLEYRRALLAGKPRMLGTLELACEKAGWGQALPAGHARGMAVHESFGSFVAHVAEVSVEGGRIRVHEVVVAIDCGRVANPAGVQAQMEGGVVFGLGAALHGAITFKEGRVQESNFHDYRVLRMNEMPVVETHIVPSTEKPGGVGEPGVPPIAPAVANAVAALTGHRLRELPLVLPA